MKITGIIIEIEIEDKDKNMFFGFIKQFPAICAQAKTAEEVKEQVNKYFQNFINGINAGEILLLEYKFKYLNGTD